MSHGTTDGQEVAGAGYETLRSDPGRSGAWNARDLERKLSEFQTYYNEARDHASLQGHTPLAFGSQQTVAVADLNDVRWVSYSRDLVQLPVAA
jgi:hypothetical protein